MIDRFYSFFRQVRWWKPTKNNAKTLEAFLQASNHSAKSNGIITKEYLLFLLHHHPLLELPDIPSNISYSIIQQNNDILQEIVSGDETENFLSPSLSVDSPVISTSLTSFIGFCNEIARGRSSSQSS